MAGWWNPWWYGAYRWLADPAEPALDPGFWNLRGAVDKVLHPTVAGQASWLVGGWPQQLVPQPSYEVLHQVADTLPTTATPSTSTAGPSSMSLATASPGTPAAPAALGTVRYDSEEVARILEALDEDLGTFWRTQGRIVRTPYDGRQAPVTPVSITVDVDAETHADDPPELGRASQPVWTTIPDRWTAADIAAYVRDRINPTSTTNTATPGSTDGSISAGGSSLLTPQEQAQEKFRSYHQIRDSAASARLSKPPELTKSEKLQAYLQGVLAQDDGEFRRQFQELAGNLGRAAWTPPEEMGAYARGFLTGFFIRGAWENIQGLWGMVKWGAWLSWHYNPLMLQARVLSGDNFAKERQFAAKAIDVASIMYKITGVVGTKLGEGVMAHYEALTEGSADDLRQLGGTHQQFAAAMLGLAVKLSGEVADAGKRGEIVGAISWEIAQTAAEILLTAGVSKVATGSAKFARIADKLADFGKYSDKFGDVAKQIARWFDEGGELRRLLTWSCKAPRTV
jgi:hypothetical protein